MNLLLNHITVGLGEPLLFHIFHENYLTLYDFSHLDCALTNKALRKNLINGLNMRLGLNKHIFDGIPEDFFRNRYNESLAFEYVRYLWRRRISPRQLYLNISSALTSLLANADPSWLESVNTLTLGSNVPSQADCLLLPTYMTNVTSIDLSHCMSIGDDKIIKLLEGFGFKLNELKLINSDMTTGNVLIAILDLCPNLETLCLTRSGLKYSVSVLYL